MKLTLLDTRTLKTVDVDDDISDFQWADGNWSDDCNRINYFTDIDKKTYYDEVRQLILLSHTSLKNDENFLKNDNFCLGCRRFLVTSIQDEKCDYTVLELNGDYPQELIDKYIT